MIPIKKPIRFLKTSLAVREGRIPRDLKSQWTCNPWYQLKGPPDKARSGGSAITRKGKVSAVARTLAQVIATERRLRQADNDQGAGARSRLSQDRISGLLTQYIPDVPDDQIEAASERSSTEYKQVRSFVMREMDLARGYSETAMNVVATKDATNMLAKASLIVGGETLLADVGISHLLWLEGYLNEWRGYLAALPVLPATKDWKQDEANADLWKAAPDTQPKTRKKTVALVLHPGTEKHPPQAVPNIEDVRIGRTVKTAYSGAITEERRRQLTDRCDTLILATRDAISRADQTPAVEVTDEGSAILGYILG
jgi:hypothetical protein